MVTVTAPESLGRAIATGHFLPVIGWGYPDFIRTPVAAYLGQYVNVSEFAAAAPYSRQAYENAAAEWLQNCSVILKPIYEAIAALGCEAILSFSPDPLLQNIVEAYNSDIAIIQPGQTSFKSATRAFLSLGGTANAPADMLLTPADAIALPSSQYVLWEMAERRSARVPFVVFGCDPSERSVLHLLSRLRPCDDFAFPGWVVCGDIRPRDQARWEARGFEVVILSPAFLPRYLMETSAAQINRTTLPATAGRAQPYKHLDYYERTEADIFFGREEAVSRLLDLANAHRLTILTGASGAGKTSLVNAGLLAHTDKTAGSEGVYVRCGNDANAELLRAVVHHFHAGGLVAESDGSLLNLLSELARRFGITPIVVLDQAEELFTRLGENLLMDFVNTLRNCLVSVPILARFVLVIREDYMPQLADLRNEIPGLLSNGFYLRELDRPGAMAAATRPAELAGVSFDPMLANIILDELGLETFSPPQLQIVCSRLFEMRSDRIIDMALYQRLGGARAILGRYLEEDLDKAGDDNPDLKLVLKAMVTSEATKEVLSVVDVSSRSGLPIERAEILIRHLRDHSRLLRGVQSDSGIRFELTHEYLVSEIWSWMSEQDLQRRRLEELALREVRSWQRFRQLRLGIDRLLTFEEGRDLFNPDENTLLLLLLSSVRHHRDPSLWVRRAENLESSSKLYVVETLFEFFYERELQQRRDAAEVIGLLEPWPLVTLLGSSSGRKRAAALEMIGGIDYLPAAPHVRRCLSDPAPELRSLACGVLGEFGGGSAKRALLGALEDESESTRAAALVALGRCGGKEAILPIANALNSEMNNLVKWGKEAIRLSTDEALLARLLRSKFLEKKGRAALWEEINRTPHYGRLIGAHMSRFDDDDWDRAIRYIEKFSLVHDLKSPPLSSARGKRLAQLQEEVESRRKERKERAAARRAEFVKSFSVAEISKLLQEWDLGVFLAIRDHIVNVVTELTSFPEEFSKALRHGDHLQREAILDALYCLPPDADKFAGLLTAALPAADPSVQYYACLAAATHRATDLVPAIADLLGSSAVANCYYPDVGVTVGEAADYSLRRLSPKSAVWMKHFQTSFHNKHSPSPPGL
jgi:hypothetical protein